MSKTFPIRACNSNYAEKVPFPDSSMGKSRVQPTTVTSYVCLFRHNFSTLHEESFLWILHFATPLMENSLNFNSINS